jgi:hypothetical protein
VQKVDRDHTAEVAADHSAMSMAEHVVDEKVDIAAPRRGVIHVGC